MPSSSSSARARLFTAVPNNLYAHGGSAGCVNLSVPDARRLWDLLTEGDAVHAWGTKPGTED